MRYWKFSSRWSDTGDFGSSILDIFFKHRMAICNPGEGNPDAIETDDLIAISDGHQIVAVAKAASRAFRMGEKKGLHLSRNDQDRLGDDWKSIWAVKIRFFPDCLNGGNPFIEYRHRKRFCEIHQRTVIDRMYEVWSAAEESVESSRFQIEAGATTLEKILADEKIRLFLIPIFQRPYSWSEPEIERFLGDILRAQAKEEDMFIGTMQFSSRRILSTRGTEFREIIDGQQRMITCALILKTLLLLRPGNTSLAERARGFSWIETRVS
ncbi:MAG: DUF262 domain-containing protein, partial [Candidatus Omnitrophica bacterium]|nr:DUF262 domain-containing protein [Candidatus Omnitrophota bacterium]